MRRLLLPLLLTVLGTVPVWAEPQFNPRVRYIHDESLAHGSAAEVPAPRKRLSMRLQRTVDVPAQPSLRLDARPSDREDNMVVVERVLVDQLTATKSPNLVVTAMPQIIKSADGRLPGLGVTVRF